MWYAKFMLIHKKTQNIPKFALKIYNIFEHDCTFWFLNLKILIFFDVRKNIKCLKYKEYK